MSKHPLTKGFSAIEAIVALLVIAVLGFGGWYVWSRKQSTEQKQALSAEQRGSNSPNGNSQETRTTQKDIALVDGRLTFPDDGTWKVATGGYWSMETQHCGRGNEVDPDCLDTIMLIPATETFTNADQFQVNVNVFERHGVPLVDWLSQNLQLRDADEALIINGHQALRYRGAYTKDVGGFDEVRVTYGIEWGDRVILVRSNLFNGDYYGYKSTTNYLPYESAVDKLAKSAEF